MKTTLLQLSLYFLVLLSACKKNTPSATSNTTETTSTVTVTFNSNGGTSISVQSINSGATAAQPTNPTKTNYTFEGWYSDAALTTPFSFSTAITSNITLYAKFAIAKSTVTFNSNGGTSISAQLINSGATATQPTNPTKTNFIFEGWYSDAALTTSFAFSTAITSNITLYAKFIPTVVINGKTYKTVVIGTQTWLAENLNAEGTGGVSSCYDNNTANCTTDGRLYNWGAAMAISDEIAGWHLPNNDEWATLRDYLGGENVAGRKMKVGGTSGFNALFVGYQDQSGVSSKDSYTNFWSSTEYSTGNGNATIWHIRTQDGQLFTSSVIKEYRYSVRLLKD